MPSGRDKPLDTVPEDKPPSSSKDEEPEPDTTMTSPPHTQHTTPARPASSPSADTPNTSSSTIPQQDTSGTGDKAKPKNALLGRVFRSHKRHKSWDASLESHPLPSLETQGSTYPRSRSKSPLKQDVMEKDKEDEENSDHEGKRKIPTRSQSLAPVAGEWLRDVVGISVDDWPYSPDLLSCAVSLKLEQERTKNASLRLNTMHTTLEMLKTAIEAQIPPHLIPVMVASGQVPIASEVRGDSKPKSPQKPLQTATSVFKVNIPQQTQFQFHHWQKPGEPKGDFKDERKRKGSDESTPSQPSFQQSSIPQNVPLPPQQPPQLQQSTPAINTPTRRSTSLHRRNQSEASVSHLRSLYESQSQPEPSVSRGIPRPQRIQTNQPPQAYPQPPHQYPQPHWANPQTQLGSPYHPSREPNRPLYYQYQVSETRNTQPLPPPQYTPQTLGPPPPPGFQFPRRESLPPPSSIQTQGPPPVQHAPPHSLQSKSATSSPASAKKGDVSFLISTPHNPPK